MTIRKEHLALTLLAVLFPSLSFACDFAYMPSSELYERASAIFVGRVLDSPWRAGSDGIGVVTGKTTLRFSVQRKLRGIESSEVTIPPFTSDCSFPFLEGETYLVHASRRDGKLDTGSPWRPLLIKDATEALKYIEGALANRPPGLLWGIAPQSDVTVHLQRTADGDFKFRVQAGYFEVVVPPGQYTAWLERDRKLIGQRKAVRLLPGKAVFERFSDP